MKQKQIDLLASKWAGLHLKLDALRREGLTTHEIRTRLLQSYTLREADVILATYEDVERLLK